MSVSLTNSRDQISFFWSGNASDNAIFTDLVTGATFAITPHNHWYERNNALPLGIARGVRSVFGANHSWGIGNYYSTIHKQNASSYLYTHWENSTSGWHGTVNRNQILPIGLEDYYLTDLDNDGSINEYEEKTYSISTSSSSINEGDTLTTTVSTTNVAANTTLYYSLSGTGITSNDFSSGALTGFGTVDSNGDLSFSHTLANDLTTEDTENITIELYSDSSRTNKVASTSFDVLDTSTSYSLSITGEPYADSSSVNEGKTIFTTINGPPNSHNSWHYYTVSGIDSSDISSGSLSSGSVLFDYNGDNKGATATIAHILTEDNKLEGTEIFTIKWYTDSARTVLATEGSININDTSFPSPTYSISPSATSINEGSTLITAVSTSNIETDTTLYYSLSGTGITSSDFSSGALTGSGVVGSDGTFSFSHTLANDQTTEGTETANIKLFSDSNRTKQVGDTASVNISDTSKAHAYSISTSKSQVNEGESFTTTVSTNVNTGSILYWSLSGAGINSSDFLQQVSLDGWETVRNNELSFYYALANDRKTEGTENIDIKLFSDASRQTQVGETVNISINDTSTDPTYSISPSKTSVNEGDSFTTTVETKNVLSGAPLYWSLSGAGINSSDFSSGALTGSGNVDSSGKFSFSHTLANDQTTEGNETIQLKLFSDSNRTQQVASTSFDVLDTSTSYSLSITGEPYADSSSVNEGKTIFTTINGPPNSHNSWHYYTVSGIDSSDISSGSLSSGSILFNYDGDNKGATATIAHILTEDNTVEGAETFTIKWYTDSARTVLAAEGSININDTSIPSPTYSISPSATSINEGSWLTTTVSTSNIETDTTLYYSLSGTGITSSDFSSGALTGSGNVESDGTFFFYHRLANDLTTEGTETANIKLFSDPNRTKQVGETASINIYDTSKAPIYSISTSASTINEGSTLTTTVSSTDLENYTTLYYSISGTGITSSDFSSGALTGSGDVNLYRNDGTFSFSHTLANDQTTEGTETANIKLFSDPNRTKQVGNTASVNIYDTSKAPTYSISTSASTINEGSTLTTTVSTTGLENYTTLYYSISGTGITRNDFDWGHQTNFLTGSRLVGRDGTFSFSHVLANDQTTEGTETANIKLFSDYKFTKQVGETASVNISDTSKAPPTYSISTSAATINEGKTFTSFINTKNLSKETPLYWSISGSGINASDFSSGALTGSGKIDNYGSFNFKHIIANDFSHEGDEKAIINLYTDAKRSNKVASTSLIVKDTSSDDYTSDINTDGLIHIDSQIRGKLDFASDRDWFRLELIKGEKYQFDCVSNSTIDPNLYLRDAWGDYISFNDNSGIGTNARIKHIANSTGEFFLDVGDNGNNDTGSYLLYAQSIKTSDDFSQDIHTTGAIQIGGKASGKIESKSDRDWFKVELIKGSQYQFESYSDASGVIHIDAELYMRDKEGKSLGFSDNLLTYTAKETAIHFIDIGDKQNDNTGGYEIKASKIITATDDYAGGTETTGIISIGSSIPGKLNFDGDRDWFKISLIKGKKYEFECKEYNEVDADLYLRDRYGNQISFDDNSGRGDDPKITYLATSTDTYFLDVGDVDNNSTGIYQLYAKEISSSSAKYSSINGYGPASAEKAFEKHLGIDLIPRPNDGGTAWPLDNIDAKEVWMGSGTFSGATGKGVIVAVIDTGIDTDHREFKGKIVKPWDFVANNSNAEDDHGHGTHVAGTIAGAKDNRGVTGVAYDAKIMPLDVFPSRGGASYTNIAKAIRYAVDNGADVINMSLGGPSRSSAIYSALQYAESNNVVCVSAAGNGSKSSPGYPAAYATQYGFAVGADNIYKQITWFSDRAGSNSQMQYVTAPGQGIYSSYLNGGYVTWNGTSMASPHIAGICALLKSHNKNLTPAQIKTFLTTSGGNQSSTANSLQQIKTSSNTFLSSLNAENLTTENNLNGSNNNDVLIGSDNDENINAGNGNDQITGLGGYDEIDGGTGSDTAIYRGNFKDYIITRTFTFGDNLNLSNNSIEIEDNRTTSNDGIDVLKNIEYIEFSDQTVEESKVDIIKTYSGKFSDYKFYSKGNNIYQIKTDDGFDDITGLPLLTFTGESEDSQFRDISSIVDIKETFDQVTGFNTDSGKMFRLYNASFKRLPDADGLKYWIEKYSSGENDERAVASSFLVSDEFKGLYGENVSDTAYVNNLYKNVLGRDADGSGLNYWLGQLDSGAETRYEVLLGFSESAENKTLFTEMTGFG